MTERTTTMSEAPNADQKHELRPERGHRRKIRAAIEALDAQGLLPPYLRTVERDALVFAELVRLGYTNAMPSRWSIRREFIRMGRSAPNARRRTERMRA